MYLVVKLMCIFSPVISKTSGFKHVLSYGFANSCIGWCKIIHLSSSETGTLLQVTPASSLKVIKDRFIKTSQKLNTDWTEQFLLANNDCLLRKYQVEPNFRLISGLRKITMELLMNSLRKWNQIPKIKFWTRLFVFQFMLVLWWNEWIYMLFPKLFENSRDELVVYTRFEKLP